MTDVTVADDKIPALDCGQPQPFNLNVGQSVICSGVYTVTQDDLDNGSVTNIATTTATPPLGGPLPPVTDEETASAIQLIELSMDKTVDTNALDPFHYDEPGDIVTYTYALTNTGNVSLRPPFAVSDDHIVSVNCPADASGVGNGDAICSRMKRFFVRETMS